ncbi:MAG TPA: sigma-70 family RNA polymerase sigma factor [Actinomycetota bacterium]|jgi:RNA polymerase sigma-70 factor (ECF subfamily)
MGADGGFRRFYEEQYEAVFRAVFLLCRDREVAEDATQDAFVRALERWRRLGDASWAGGWVTTTALNRARRLLRRRPADPTALAPVGEQEAAIDLWRAVAALPLRHQQAVVLHYRLGLSTAETAAAMGCGDGTLRAYLTRARRSLERALTEEADGTRPDR